jgi:hypothetical protein
MERGLRAVGGEKRGKWGARLESGINGDGCGLWFVAFLIMKIDSSGIIDF